MMPIRNLVLAPLSWVFETIVRLRNLAYDKKILSSYQPDLPVICIGNLTAGGSGKTPLVLWLVAELKSQGINPVILSRGYRGTNVGVCEVGVNSTYQEVGDEPLLMAKRKLCPVVVSSKRVLGVEYITKKRLGDLIILDDGFQHRKLKSSFNIITIDASSHEAQSQFLSGKLLPFGRFREPLKPALSRIDCFVISARTPAFQANTEFLEYLTDLGRPSFLAEVVPKVFSNNESATLEVTPQWVAFCGIANPGGFFTTLKGLGITPFAEISFPDHYPFTNADIERLRAKYPAGKLICTEKDFIKIPDNDLNFVRIDLKVTGGENLISLIKAKCGGAIL